MPSMWSIAWRPLAVAVVAAAAIAVVRAADDGRADGPLSFTPYPVHADHVARAALGAPPVRPARADLAG